MNNAVLWALTIIIAIVGVGIVHELHSIVTTLRLMDVACN